MAGDNKKMEEMLSANIAVSKQLADVIARLAENQEKHNKSSREQVDIGKEMNDVLGEIEKKRKEEEEKTKKRLEDLEKEIDNIDSLNGAMKFLIKNLKEKYKASKSLAVGLAAAAGAMKGFQQGMKMTMSLLSGLGGILQSVIGGLFDIGIAILTGPIKMFNALFSKAKDAMSGGTEVAQAIEKIRENFGDVSTGLGKNVKDMGTALTQGLIAPGLRSMQVFGNLAEAMNYVNELAMTAPAQFQAVQDQMKNNTKEILSMAKGLGIAKEDFQGLMNASISSGIPLMEIEKDMTKYAKGMASEFGLDSKMISRDMGRAMKDVKHFANVSVKELAKATTYAHGLGLELKDITGVLDAFNTFDQAAENVSKLSQAFGVNLDTMKLLEAKTPDEAIDQIKQAFTAAGKSADQMNRQELQLIASTVGMDEAAVRQAFSTKNAGISLQKAKSASAALEGQTMSTAQAMQVLSKDIEKMVKAGEPPKGENFFDVFFEGFAQGVERTAEFRGVLQNLMKSIWVVRQAGIELGQAFVRSFPGFRDVLSGLADILAPDKIGGLFKSFSATLTEFFASLKDGSMSVETLFKKLQQNVMDYFTAAGPGGQKFLNGLSDMWKAAKFIIVGALDYIGDMLKDGLTRFADFLDNGLDKGINSLKDGVMGEASPIIDAFARLYEKLKDPVARIMTKAFDWVFDKVGNYFKEHWFLICSALLGPSIIMGVGQAFASASVMLLVETIFKPWLKKFVGAAGAASSADFKELGSKMDGLKEALEKGGKIGPAGDNAGKVDWGKVKNAFAQLMVFVVAGLIALAGVLVIMKAFSVKQEDLLTIGVLVVSMAVLMLTAAASMKIASSVQVDGKSALKNLGSLALVVGAMLAAAYGIVRIAKEAGDVTAGALTAVMTIMVAVGLMFLEAAAVVAILTWVGKAVEGGKSALIQGAIAVGIVATVMFVAAIALVEVAKKAPEEGKMKGVSAILDSVSVMFLSASVVVLAAMAIGAIIMGTFGAGAAAAAAGFAAIASAVAGMAATAQIVSERINNMKVADPASFLLKCAAVAMIMDSVTKMTLAVAEVIGSIPPDIAKDAGRIDSLAKMITDMMKGIEGIITKVVEAVEHIGASDSTLKAAASLANVMSAVAEIAKALQPGDLKEIYKSIDNDDFEKIPGIISAVTNYASRVTDSLIGKGKPPGPSILGVVEKMVGIAAKWNEGDVPKVEALGKVIGAIAPILSALTIPPGLSGALTEATKNWTGPNAGELLDQAAQYIQKVTPKFQSLVEGIMDKFPPLITALAGITFSEGQAKAIDSFIPIIKIALETATGMARTALAWAEMGLKKEDLDNLTKSDGILAAASTTLAKLMDTMAEKFPGFVNSIVNAVKEIKVPPEALSGMNSLLSVFKFFGEFMGFFKGLKTAITEDKGSEFAGRLTVEEVDSYVENIGSMTVVIDRMLDMFIQKAGYRGLDSILQKLETMSTTIGKYKDINTDKIKGIFETIKSVFEIFKTFKDMNIGEFTKKALGENNEPLMGPELSVMGFPTGGLVQLTNLEVMVGDMSGFLDALAAPTGLPSLKEPLSKISKIFDDPEFTDAFAKGSSAIASINGLIGKVKSAVEGVKGDFTKEAVAAKLSPIRDAMTEIQTQISSIIDLNPKTIDGKLELKGGKMELVVSKKPEVEKKPINITINLTATLDVGDIGKGLSQHRNPIKLRIDKLEESLNVSH